jgi:hypothetical protein
MEPEGLLPCSQDPAADPVRREMSPVNNFQPYFPKIHFNIILQSTTRPSECSHHLDFPTKVSYHLSSLPCVLHDLPMLTFLEIITV